MCSISSSELLGLILKQFVHLTFAFTSNLYLVIGANKDLYNKQCISFFILCKYQKIELLKKQDLHDRQFQTYPTVFS